MVTSRHKYKLTISILFACIGLFLSALGVTNRTTETAAVVKIIVFMNKGGVGSSPELTIYIQNETKFAQFLLNDVDSINIAPNVVNSTIDWLNARHCDYGRDKDGRFIKVQPGESLRMRLGLRKEDCDLLLKSRAVRIPVKLRLEEGGKEQSVLIEGHVSVVVEE